LLLRDHLDLELDLRVRELELLQSELLPLRLERRAVEDRNTRIGPRRGAVDVVDKVPRPARSLADLPAGRQRDVPLVGRRGRRDAVLLVAVAGRLVRGSSQVVERSFLFTK